MNAQIKNDLSILPGGGSRVAVEYHWYSSSFGQSTNPVKRISTGQID